MEGQRAEAFLHGPVFAWGLVRVQVGVRSVSVTQRPDAASYTLWDHTAPAPHLLPVLLGRSSPGEGLTWGRPHLEEGLTCGGTSPGGSSLGRGSPALQHLLEEVVLLGRLLRGHMLITHVAQLARWVGLHGLAPSALLASPGEDAGLLWAAGDKDGDATDCCTQGHEHSSAP